MATPDHSTDDGPRFVSDLVRELRELQATVEESEVRLISIAGEHNHFRRRLDAVEATLKAIGVRESDLAEEATLNRGKKIGQRNVGVIALTALVPLLVAFLTWFVPATLNAIKHANVEEELWQEERRLPPRPASPPPPPPIAVPAPGR